MDKKKIAIIGAGRTGISTAIEHAAMSNNICALHSVVDSQFTEQRS